MYMPKPPLYLKLCFWLLRHSRKGFPFVGVVYLRWHEDNSFDWAVDEVARPNDYGLVMGHVQRFIKDLLTSNASMTDDKIKLEQKIEELEHGKNGKN